jgi:hypothetical protein
MLRRLTPLATVLALCLSACGTTTTHTVTVTRPATEQAATSLPCNPALGKGVMGACSPSSTEPQKQLQFASGARLIPDVSEFQPCAVYSEVIFRVYEGGTQREDVNARCHAQEAKRLHVWFAVYAFLRPAHGGCAYQAQRTVEIVRSIGGVVGPIIADAEVWLPPGFVSCFNHTIEHYGYAAVTYTAPGTWPGGAFVTKVWVAAYPYRPPCFSNACPYLAHQFADNFNCRGIRGDCSVNEGILSVRSVPVTPVKTSALLARRRALRRSLVHYGCRHRVAHREPLGPTCKRWFREGAAVNARLRARGVH